MNQELTIVGAVFWDIFEDGYRCIGGSGLNVAWHLQGLGQSSYFISKVGQDENGRILKADIEKWGISTHLIQSDPEYPTGTLTIYYHENGLPDFVSPPLMAFDFIDYDKSFDQIPNSSILYHDSYILRSPKTRQTVETFKQKGLPVFMDINLRDPYWTDELLDHWVQDLSFFKISDQEFGKFMKVSPLGFEKDVPALQKILKDRNIKTILYTCGELGSMCITQNDVVIQKPNQIFDRHNTVGAGDAYCAGFLFSALNGKSNKDGLAFATKLAEKICTIQGASSPDQSFYTDLLS